MSNEIIHICRGPRRIWSRCSLRMHVGVKCMTAKQFKLGVEVIEHAGSFALVNAICIECARSVLGPPKRWDGPEDGDLWHEGDDE